MLSWGVSFLCNLGCFFHFEISLKSMVFSDWDRCMLKFRRSGGLILQEIISKLLRSSRMRFPIAEYIVPLMRCVRPCCDFYFVSLKRWNRSIAWLWCSYHDGALNVYPRDAFRPMGFSISCRLSKFAALLILDVVSNCRYRAPST